MFKLHMTNISDLKSGEPSCPDVHCPSLPTGLYCRPITSPGACCPKCAGEIRVLYSMDLMNKVSRGAGNRAITIQDVIEVFRQQIAFVECDVFGYLSIEGDLVLLIMPITRHPTTLQVTARNIDGESVVNFEHQFNNIIHNFSVLF